MRSSSDEKILSGKTNPDPETQSGSNPIALDGVGNEWKSGQILFNGYRVVSVIGRGGMGTVYLVERPLSSRVFQFAVKTLKSLNTADGDCRRSFVSELRTWIGLPTHPNLNTCYFFRTIDDRMAIFAEYISGGSLHDWIRTGRTRNLETILDIAIQIARGLAVAHYADVIHQDVKPSNILMSPEGVAKVTDFGLSRIRRLRQRVSLQDTDNQTIMVESGGLTPAYCSPEQILKKKVSRKTDIFSFGVTLMEMISGRVHWKISTVVPHILMNWVRRPEERPIPNLSPRFLEFLTLCLHDSPAERWGDFNIIGEQLEAMYFEETGHSYPVVPEAGILKMPKEPTSLRPPVREGCPEFVCELMTSAYGFPASLWEDYIPSADASQQSKDLSALDLMEHLLSLQSDKGITVENDSTFLIANTLLTRAVILDRLGDTEGSLESLTACFNIIDNSDRTTSFSTPSRLIIIASFHMGLSQPDPNLSKAHYDRADQTIEKNRNTLTDIEYFEFKSSVFNNRGGVFYRLSDRKNALTTYEEANRLVDLAVDLNPRPDLIFHSASTKSNLGILYFECNHISEAIRSIDDAIAQLHSIWHLNECKINRTLAMIEMHRALFLQINNERESAIAGFNKCIEMLDDVIERGDSLDAEETRNRCCVNKAYILSQIGRSEEADLLSESTILEIEKLVYRHGKFQLENDLALLHFNRADILNKLSRPAEAIAVSQHAVDIWNYLFIEFNNRAALNYLAEIQENRHDFALNIPNPEIAEESIREAIRYRKMQIAGHFNVSNAINLSQMYRKFARFLLRLRRMDTARTTVDSALKLIDDAIRQGDSTDLTVERDQVLALKHSF